VIPIVYFDERPKEKREDLYDREEELSSLINYIRNCKPLILILGLRRTGKTSLVKVAINEIKRPSIYIDCRVFEEKIAISIEDFIRHLGNSISSSLRRWKGLIEYMKSIRSASIFGFRIEFSWKGESRTSISEVFDAINSYGEDKGLCIPIIFDEVQELSKLKGINLLPIFAYAYDNLRNISVILTGSKIGLLYRFLKINDSSSPLYGRVKFEINLKNLSRRESIDYLIKGFNQLNIKAPIDVIEYAVDRLNGIIGWLTYFGVKAIIHGVKRETVDLTLIEGSKLAISELENFLKIRPIARKRYLIILRRIADNPASWSEIKRYLESIEGRVISKSNLTLLLRNLVNAGFISKNNENKYYIVDPILRYAFYSGLIKL